MSGLVTSDQLAIVEMHGGLNVMTYSDKTELAEAAVRQCWSEFTSPKEYLDWVTDLATRINAHVSENVETMQDIMAEHDEDPVPVSGSAADVGNALLMGFGEGTVHWPDPEPGLPVPDMINLSIKVSPQALAEFDGFPDMQYALERTAKEFFAGSDFISMTLDIE